MLIGEGDSSPSGYRIMKVVAVVEVSDVDVRHGIPSGGISFLYQANECFLPPIYI